MSYHKQICFRFLTLYALGNAVLFWLIGSRYLITISPLALSIPTISNYILVWSYLLLAFLGHLGLLALLVCLLLTPLFLLKNIPSRLLIASCITLESIAVFFLIVDTFVFAQFRFHLNGVIWQLISSGEMQQIFNLSGLEWALASFTILGIIAIEYSFGIFLWRKLSGKTSHSSQINLAEAPNNTHSAKKYRPEKWIIAVIAICYFLSLDMFMLGGIDTSLSLTPQARALPLYNDAISLLLPIKKSSYTVESLGNANFIQPKQANQPLIYPLHPLQCSHRTRPLNIVLIVIDTWRFDMLNKAVTPHLYQFSQHSMHFNNHISGGNGTQSGMFSLFYGLPSSYWTSALEQGKGPVLIHELLNQHYQMGIFASAELNKPDFVHTLFRDVANITDKMPGETPFIRDSVITDKFIQFIHNRRLNQPFFGFLFYDGAHSYCEPGNPVSRFQPSIATCNHLALSDNSDPSPYLNRYKNALFSVDQETGRVFQALKETHLLENTLVIITSDHGQEFNDNHQGFWEHASNYTRYQVQVPFIMKWPGKIAEEMNYKTTHYDMAPTLLTQALGCENPPTDYSIGQSLFLTNSRDYLLSSSYIDFGLIEPDRITTIFSTGNFQISDLHAKPIPNAQLRIPILREAFTEMERFYKRSN